MSIEPNLSNLTSVGLFQQANPIRVHFKETSQQVLSLWDSLMAPINSVININGSAGNPASEQITEAQRAAFQTALNSLINLARNGHTYTIQLPGPPPSTKDVTDVITVEMAQDLDNLLRTIESAHTGAQFTAGVASISIDALRAWRDFSEATPVIKQIVQHMNSARAVGGVWNQNGTYLDGAVNDRGILQVGSLQSMIELLFVKTGNELLADNLEELEGALQINKSALDSLAAIQSMHNNITAVSKGLLPQEAGAIGGSGVLDDDAAADYVSETGEIAKFFESIKPKLGPGMESAYDIFQSYTDVITKLNDSPSISSTLQILKNTIDQSITDINMNPVLFILLRPTLVQNLQRYNAMAREYNNLLTQLDQSLRPFKELLGLPVDGPLTFTYNLSSFTYDFTTNAHLPLATFTSEQVPPVTSFTPDLTAFRDNFLIPTQTLFSSINPSTVIPDVGDLHNVDSAAVALYSQPNVINGNSAAGLPPIANIDLANRISMQYQILKNQAAALNQDPSQASNPNSLLSTLNVVIADLKAAGVENISDSASFSALTDAGKKAVIQSIDAFAKKWILDGLEDTTNSSQSGKIQEHLGIAIAAGQSLNDQQKEETRRFLFLFEEFYKSASAILTKITQILEKMAQNINR